MGLFRSYIGVIYLRFRVSQNSGHVFGGSYNKGYRILVYPNIGKLHFRPQARNQRAHGTIRVPLSKKAQEYPHSGPHHVQKSP